MIFSKLRFWPNLVCQGCGKTIQEEAWARDFLTSYREEGKAKAQKRVQEAHTGVTGHAALQSKQMPAGYNVAEFSKDYHFILLHLILMSNLAAPK